MSQQQPVALITEQVLHALVHCVRMFSFEQLATAWWHDRKSPRRAARTWVNKFLSRGDVGIQTVHAIPMSFAIDRPVVCWDPGDPDPDCEAASYQLVNRWKERASEPTEVVFATNQAANRLGGFGGPLTHPEQATHDLHLAAVYLHVLRDYPTVAAAWKGEEHYRHTRAGKKLPDAIIFEGDQVRLVVESGGQYDSNRVRAFHRDCKRRGHAYQLW